MLMLKSWLQSRRAQVWVLGCLVLAAIFVFWGPQECISTNYEGQYHATAAEQFAFFFHVHFWCGGRLLRESAEIITALATVVLTGSTIALWLVTKESADAGISAVKLARSEFNATHRPHVIVHALDALNAGPDNAERMSAFRAKQ